MTTAPAGRVFVRQIRHAAGQYVHVLLCATTRERWTHLYFATVDDVAQYALDNGLAIVEAPQ